MRVTFDSRRKSPRTLDKAHPGARIIDVTSKAEEPWVRLSPFYPHGGIPVPFSKGRTSESVEGIWQALKVFDSDDVDPSKLAITSMKGLKRTVRKYGPVVGHRKGLSGKDILDYRTARLEIYLPSYLYLLEVSARQVVEQLRQTASETPIVLLDYETNGDIDDLTRPLSHASLVAAYLNGEWPSPS